METAAGGRGVRIRWPKTAAAGGKCRRYLSGIRSAVDKAASELHPLLDTLYDKIALRKVEKRQLCKKSKHKIDVLVRELRFTLKEAGKESPSLSMRRTIEETVNLKEKMGKVSLTDTQVMSIYFKSVFDSIFMYFRELHRIVDFPPVLDWELGVSELFKTAQDSLTRIRLETRFELDKIEEEEEEEEEARLMETAEGSQGELMISDEVGEEVKAEGSHWWEFISTSAAGANEMGEEGVTWCIENAELEEIGKANEMGEEDEKAAAELGMMPTNQFFGIYRCALMSRLSRLFSSPCEDDCMTSLSPMHFTHTTLPGASVATTLQIFSVSVQEIKEDALGLNWPLSVYGTVAARDTVDRNRNLLFHRERNNCQILTRKDPCLQLTGPSRSIVATEPVDFEIELKVKGRRRNASEDRVLMHQTFVYSGRTTTLLSNDCCKIMLRCAKLENTVQATVVSVRVRNWRKRAWPFKDGGKVTCVAKGPVVKPQVKEEEVVLQHQLADSASHDGYLDLSRHAVSVDLSGELRVIIRSSKFSGHVFFPAQECKSSKCIFLLGTYEVEVTVAWSLLIPDKRCFISREECVDDGQEFRHKWMKTKLLETQSAKKIYSLLDIISQNAVKLKAFPKLRISDYSISEVKIHMDSVYRDMTSLLRMMEKVHNGTEILGQKPYGLDAIFNELDQLCTQLDQMGHLSYKGKSQLFSELSKDSISKVKLDEIEPPMEAAKGNNAVSIEEANEMGGEDEESDSDKTQTEEEYFEMYRQSWVYNWSISCGTFTKTTSLSPMHFTHSTLGHEPRGALVGSSLQIYSIKVAKIEDDSGLNWPLRVYGVVAARDTVDRNRNILFSRQRNNCQILTLQDPFLRLTGPSRAIVIEEHPHVEIELKVKGATKSEDSVLMSHFWYHSSLTYIGLRNTLCIPIQGDYCTLVLSAEHLGDSVQATIVGIHVRVPEGKPSPFEYGGRVVCSSLPRREVRLPDSEHIAADPSFRQVVLQDGEMTTCSKGYLNLSRHVVSVKLRGKLEVVIEARSQSGAMAGQAVASMEAQKCYITKNVCHLGDAELEISVAWSCLVEDKKLVSSL